MTTITVTMSAQIIQISKSLNDFCCMVPAFRELWLQDV